MAEFETEHGGLYYELLGPVDDHGAEWITLLHNFMSTGRSAWGIIAERLAEHYRVLLPDLPGHGQSLGQPPSFQHQQMGRQIADLMQFVGADFGHLAGCSSGGMIAELIVEHEYANPSTLILISSTYSVNPATTGEDSSVSPSEFRASGSWLEATARLHDPYRYEGYFEDVLLNRFQRLRPEWVIDLSLDALEEWILPVCIIHGGEDEFFPTAIPRKMAAAIPDAEVHIVPEQGHGLIFQRPGKVRSIMIEFLERHPLKVAS